MTAARAQAVNPQPGPAETFICQLSGNKAAQREDRHGEGPLRLGHRTAELLRGSRHLPLPRT